MTQCTGKIPSNRWDKRPLPVQKMMMGIRNSQDLINYVVRKLPEMAT